MQAQGGILGKNTPATPLDTTKKSDKVSSTRARIFNKNATTTTTKNHRIKSNQIKLNQKCGAP